MSGAYYHGYQATYGESIPWGCAAGRGQGSGTQPSDTLGHAWNAETTAPGSQQGDHSAVRRSTTSTLSTFCSASLASAPCFPT